MKILPTYHSSPIYTICDEGFYEPTDLDEFDVVFSLALQNKINTWSNWFDRTLNMEDPPISGFNSIEEIKKFEITGVEIWAELSQVLGETIKYKSEVLDKYFESIEAFNKAYKTISVAELDDRYKKLIAGNI